MLVVFPQNLEMNIISITFTTHVLAVSQTFSYSYTGCVVERNPSVLQKKEIVNFKQNFIRREKCEGIIQTTPQSPY